MQHLRTSTNLYLEKQFPKNETTEHEKTDLIMLYERLVNTIYLDTSYEVETEAWKNCLQRLPEMHEKIKRIPNIDVEIRLIKISTQNLETEEGRYLDDIKASSEKYTLSKLIKAQYESNQCVLARRKASQEKLLKLEVIFKDFISLYELLWYMLMIEGKYIKQTQSTFKDIQLSNKSIERGIKLRILDTKTLLHNDKKPIYTSLCKWLVHLMQHYNLSFKTFEDTSDFISLYNKLQNDKETEIYLHHEQINLILQDIKNCDKILLDKNAVLYCGISKNPVVTSPCHYALFRSRSALQELEALIMAEKNTFTRKKQAIERNKILESLHDLWIDFLCEPEKVHVLIKNVKTAIQNNSRLANRSRI